MMLLLLSWACYYLTIPLCGGACGLLKAVGLSPDLGKKQRRLRINLILE